MSDPLILAGAARTAHERVALAEREAIRFRAERDGYIQQLRTQFNWSYGKIAQEVGISRGMVAVICRPLVNRTWT